MRTKVELCESCTVLAWSHWRARAKILKILPLKRFFSCSLLSKNHSWWSKLFQHACCSKIHPQHNTWHGRFITLITLIHITRLDYCMQYKSFIILGHAYFFEPIYSSRDTCTCKRWSVPTESITGCFFLKKRTHGSRLDGDDDGAVSTQKLLSKQVSSLSSSGLCSHRTTDIFCLQRKFGSVAKQNKATGSEI